MSGSSSAALPPRPLDVVVLAGGRIDGEFATATGQTVKALVAVHGVTLLRRVLNAAAECPGLGRVIVVGPDSLASELRGEEELARERGRALDNLCAGLDALHVTADEHRDLLVLASDSPTLTAAALADFLARAPAAAEIAIPVVTKERFLAAYPGSRTLFVPLAAGACTMGGQALVSPAAIHRNLPLMQRLFDQRKSQLGMARLLGPAFLVRLLTRTLTVEGLEERAVQLTRCRSQAVRGCDAALAFDVDSLADAQYLERHPPLGWQ